MFAGRLAGAGRKRARRGAGREGGADRRAPPRGSDLLLDGLATFFSDSYEAAVPILRRAQDAFDVSDACPRPSSCAGSGWRPSRPSTCGTTRGGTAISERHVQIARETGALGELPLALSQRVYVHLFAGELTAAASLVDEIRGGDRGDGQHPRSVRRGGTRRAARPRG